MLLVPLNGSKNAYSKVWESVCHEYNSHSKIYATIGLSVNNIFFKEN